MATFSEFNLLWNFYAARKQYEKGRWAGKDGIGTYSGSET
jgi:hypothetical protein